MLWALLAGALALCLFLFDFQNMLSRRRGNVLELTEAESDDVTLVVPVYGAPRYFPEDQRRRLEPLRHLCLVSVDVGGEGMDAFADELARDGWRVVRTRDPQPSAPVMMLAALPFVETRYVVRLDADTDIGDGVLNVVAAVAAADADVASVKCSVANESASWATRFQALEYRMAMLSRHFRPWQTSGACHIAKTSSMRAIFERHSLWMPGEDIEVGRTANALLMKVRHVNYEVWTDAPPTWRALYRQRRLWWAGNFRHVWINFDRNIVQMPGYTFYYFALVWCGIYFKWYTLAFVFVDPARFLRMLVALFIVYGAVTFVANWQVRRPLMLLFPAYALMQAVLMPIVGSIYYAQLAQRKGRLGRYGFPIRRYRVLPPLPGAYAALRAPAAYAHHPRRERRLVMNTNAAAHGVPTGGASAAAAPMPQMRDDDRSERTARRLALRLDELGTALRAAGVSPEVGARLLESAAVAMRHAVSLDLLSVERARAIWHDAGHELPPNVAPLRAA